MATHMCPGACVTASGSLAAMIAVCGVTPHAQNTGTSGWSIVTASPQCGALSSAALMPRVSGLPQWIGAPCAPALKRHGCGPHMRAEAVKRAKPCRRCFLPTGQRQWHTQNKKAKHGCTGIPSCDAPDISNLLGAVPLDAVALGGHASRDVRRLQARRKGQPWPTEGTPVARTLHRSAGTLHHGCAVLGKAGIGQAEPSAPRKPSTVCASQGLQREARAYGLMDTTSSPRKGPTGWFGMFVRNIGTFFPSATCRGVRPASASSPSQLNEQPSAARTVQQRTEMTCPSVTIRNGDDSSGACNMQHSRRHVQRS